MTGWVFAPPTEVWVCERQDCQSGWEQRSNWAQHLPYNPLGAGRQEPPKCDYCHRPMHRA